ncbi:MAG: M20/M25/M40 family metallo-hydrolase [Candidatus Moraniibacteriota bacterium]
MILENNIKFLKELVSLRTITGEHECQKKAIAVIKKNLPMFFKSVSYCNNRYNSELFYSSDKNKFDVLFAVHVDVVVGKKESFKLRKETDRLCGRGVFDMKGPIVAIVNSINDFYKISNRKISVGLLVTSDEERGGFSGTGFVLNKSRLDIGLAIVPDGGENLNSLIMEEKGVLDMELSYRGISSHVSRPWNGKNAAENLARVVNKIIDHFPKGNEKQWKTIASLIEFKSEFIAENVIPSFAKARMIFRYTKKDSTEKILKFIKSLDKAVDIKVLAHGDVFVASNKNNLVQIYRDIVKLKTGKSCLSEKYHSACDGRFFSSRGIPTIITRPLGGDAHSDNEWISISSLATFSDILTGFLEKIEKLK